MNVDELIKELRKYDKKLKVVFGDDLGTCGEYSDQIIQKVKKGRIKNSDRKREIVIRLL